MWLRLTDKDTNNQKLYNMANMDVCERAKDIHGIYFTVLHMVNKYPFSVLESIDEIEIMLAGKGAEVKRADPGERSWIGGNKGWDEGNNQDA
jgi:hypothetical protein